MRLECKEGDLVYHPVLNKLFEVSFVDHDEPFHQLDNNPVYKLRCRQFEYSSEVLDTGVELLMLMMPLKMRYLLIL